MLALLAENALKVARMMRRAYFLRAPVLDSVAAGGAAASACEAMLFHWSIWSFYI